MIHTVRPGDSLWSIASTLCRNPYLWRQIADDNHIRGSTILVGQSLVVSDALCSRRAGAGMVDLADMKFIAERTQAALAEQPGEVPAIVFKAFVLHAEQALQR